MKKDKIDVYEREILDGIERGQWKSSPVSAYDAARYQQYARATLKKNKRINIRIAQGDLTAIQNRAVDEGIPYQTLMASVLHKYAVGTLMEAPAKYRSRSR